ncbi:MAG: hypothetical protein QM736_00945 [Vicinamibacterales bacterium]
MHFGGGVDGRAVGDDAEYELAFGGQLLASECGRLGERDAATTTIERDLEAETIARYDLPPEFRAVDAAKIHARLRRGFLIAHQDGRCLGERLDHQDGRQEWRAGKVTGKEFLVDGDVLDSHQTPPRIVLENGVDEHRRIAVTQALERLRYVDGHSCQSIRTPTASRTREGVRHTAKRTCARLTGRAIARLAKRP